MQFTSELEDRRLVQAFFGVLQEIPTQESRLLQPGSYPNDFGYATHYNGNIIGKLMPNMKIGCSRQQPVVGSTRCDIWFCYVERDTENSTDFRLFFFVSISVWCACVFLVQTYTLLCFCMFCLLLIAQTLKELILILLCYNQQE